VSEPRDDVLPSERATPPSQTRVVLQILLIIGGVALGLWALSRLATVVLVLILAALFAYVLAPLVQLAERSIHVAGRRRRLSRGTAIALVYVVTAGGVAGGAALLLPTATEQVNDMVARAPTYAQSILTWEHNWSRYYERLRIPIELRQSIDQSVRAAGAGVVESVRGSLLTLVGALSDLPWLVLIPILAFFLLKDAAGFRRTILTALPHRVRLRGHRLFDDLNATLAAYIRAQILACLLVGSLCGLGFAALGIPYPVPLGALAGVLEFIPLIGPLLVAVIASILGALHSPVLVLWVVGFLGGLRLVEDYVIYPRLISRGVPLHPLTVIIAVLCGAELDGVAGMFLAVPAVATATVVWRHWLQWRSDDGAVDGAPPREPAQAPH
jgi:predicted PurR-regulated permease PerM